MIVSRKNDGSIFQHKLDPPNEFSSQVFFRFLSIFPVQTCAEIEITQSEKKFSKLST